MSKIVVRRSTKIPTVTIKFGSIYCLMRGMFRPMYSFKPSPGAG
jgi:hypothetical protein